MALEVPIDVDLLKREIKKTYASLSQEPEKDSVFPTGRSWAALLEAQYGELLKRHGFERIEPGNLVATYMRSKFEDTRQKAIKFGANGSTVKAYKP
ncbi:MAG TPA: hypothetical protein VIL73_05755 [Gaiellaceae bacterium]|jgi:hypothetical protein